MKEYLIDEKLEGIRLDKCVVSLDTDLSRETAQRLIEEGNISINDKKSKASYKVSIGDKISINKPEPKETNIVPQDIPIEILYEDEDIIVVNKPKGMVVHPANRESGWNTSECNYEYMQRLSIWNRWRDKTTE